MPDQPTPGAPPQRSHWTPAKQRTFLTALVETGSVARAARAAGMSRSSAVTRLADPFAPDPLAPRKAPGDSPHRPPAASASRP